MSNYRRLISYIYEYEGKTKGRNVGFAKLEARGGQCKISVNVKKIFTGGDTGVFLLSSAGEIPLGKMFVRNGAGEFRTAVQSENVEESGCDMDGCYGLTIHEPGDDWRTYRTIWEDEVAYAAEIELAKAVPKEEPSVLENAGRVIAEMEQELAIQEGARGSVPEREENGEDSGAEVPRALRIEGTVEPSEQKNSGEETESAGKTVEERTGEAVEAESIVSASTGKKRPQRPEDLPRPFPGPARPPQGMGGGTIPPGRPPAGPMRPPYPPQPPCPSQPPAGQHGGPPAMPPAGSPPSPGMGRPFYLSSASPGRPMAQVSYPDPPVRGGTAQGMAGNAAVSSSEWRNPGETAKQDTQKQTERTPRPPVVREEKPELPRAGVPGELEGLRLEDEPEANPEQVWRCFEKTYPKIQAFDSEHGCVILVIKPQDIGLLPREVWIYGNNSFLLHGYYNYRYLILARLENPKGRPRYLLGVPGHYYSNEKYMASMFGFPNFVLSKNQPAGDGRFGYWYTDIQLGSAWDDGRETEKPENGEVPAGKGETAGAADAVRDTVQGQPLAGDQKEEPAVSGEAPVPLLRAVPQQDGDSGRKAVL